MIWWDFTNFEFLTLFIFICTLSVLFVAVVVSIIILRKKSKKYIKMIFDEKNTNRIFVVDMRSNSVSYFDVNNIQRKRNIDLASFYNLFHQFDVEKVKGWIFAICMNNENVENIITADILVGNKQVSYFSILKLLRYSQVDGKIFIESNVLKYMTPSNFVPKKSKIPSGLVAKDVMADLVNNAKNPDGYLFGIRLIKTSQNVVCDSISEKYMLYIAKNELYPFLKTGRRFRQLIDVSENECYLLDLYLRSKEEAMDIANLILTKIKGAIATHGFQNSLTVCISVVSNKLFYQDFDTLFDRAQISTMDTSGGISNIVYYERNSMFSAKIETAKFNNQINHLIEDKTAIRCLYRPIINVSDGSCFGYASSLRLYDSPFANLFEAARYAAKINKSKELVASVLKNVITTYSNEANDKNVRLFAQSSLLGIDNINDFLLTTKHAKLIKFVLVISEDEIVELINEGKNISEIYAILSNSDFEFALLLKSDALNLDSSIYYCFDYFVFEGAVTKDIKRNNRNRFKVHTLLENLYKYKKPIIAMELEGWVSIELVIKAGVNYISSETISPSSDMLLPVDKKKCNKIAMMADKYK